MFYQIYVYSCSYAGLDTNYITFHYISQRLLQNIAAKSTLQDTHILAIIRNNQKNFYLPILKVGEVYAISNFKVVPSPKQYKPVEGDSSINFLYKTKIEKGVETASIPQHKFELKDFTAIQHLVGNVELLIGNLSH